mmetsp:Transcript_3712/g.6573  ORF Transcript_3712/g.6573 Transcript_3712/m.6573 type:complete len:172 (-) Transcript_3712:983-1498(-)
MSSTIHVSWYPGSPLLSGAPVQLTMEILSPRSKGRRTAIIIIPSISFAADGPNAKAKETRTVDSDTRSAQGFSSSMLITVSASKNPNAVSICDNLMVPYQPKIFVKFERIKNATKNCKLLRYFRARCRSELNFQLKHEENVFSYIYHHTIGQNVQETPHQTCLGETIELNF